MARGGRGSCRRGRSGRGGGSYSGGTLSNNKRKAEDDSN